MAATSSRQRHEHENTENIPWYWSHGRRGRGQCASTAKAVSRSCNHPRRGPRHPHAPRRSVPPRTSRTSPRTGGTTLRCNRVPATFAAIPKCDMNTKPDQKDIEAQISAITSACGVLVGELRVAGQTPPQSPLLSGGDALGNLDRLHEYHARLAGTLAKRPPYVLPASPNTRAAETTATIATPGAVAPVTPAELTVTELTA